MASSHHFTSLAKMKLVWRRLCEALRSSSLVRNTIAAVSPSLQRRKYKVSFVLNMDIKPHIIFFNSAGADTDVRSLNTPIVEGPIERHKPRLASRETGDGLTGTYSGRSLDRAKKVLKWLHERRARAGLREASRRDKAMRSWSLHLPDASVPSQN